MKIPEELNRVTPLSKGLALVIVIFLPIIGFMLGRLYQIKAEMQNITPVVPMVTNQVIADEVSSPSAEMKGWKTYDGQYFSLNYPQTYTYKEKSVTKTPDYPQVLNSIELSNKRSVISITVARNTKNYSLNKLLGNGPYLSYIDSLYKGKNPIMTQVDGKSAIVMKDFNAGRAGISVDVVTISNNLVYQFVLEPGDVNDSLFNQILSTVKFSGSVSPSPSPSAAAGTMCGGIAGILCPTGFTCKMDGNYPDASGKCVAL